jgi:hypothetical protein
LEFGRLDDWTSRRPLFPVLVSGLLRLTNQNLREVLILLTAAAAWAVGLAGWAIWRTHGPLASLWFTALQVVFYRTAAGILMSEQLGFIAGCIAFSLLWLAVTSDSCHLPSLLVGLFLFGLAQAARPGAFLALPVLALGGPLLCVRRSHTGRTLVAVAVIAVLAGFGANSLLRLTVGRPGQPAFANLAHTLYGLASGGKGWGQVLLDHPEIAEESDAQQSRMVYALAWNRFKDKPADLLTGLVKGVRATISGRGVTNFIDGWIGVVALDLPLLLGIIAAARVASDAGARLSLLVTLGVALSAPILIEPGGSRFFAATAPALAAMAALGLRFVAATLTRPRRASPFTPSDAEVPFRVLWPSGVILLAVIGLGAVTGASASKPTTPGPPCRPSQRAAVVFFHPGTAVRVGGGGAFSGQPNAISASLFRRNAASEEEHRSTFELQKPFAGLPDDSIILDGFDLVGRRQLWVVFASGSAPREISYYAICGAEEAGVLHSDAFHSLGQVK